jgi:predicted MPP superfamily phosphohydrolase
MTLGQLAPIVIGTAVQVGFHYYLWRRLVRDPGWSALVRRVATAAIVVLGVSTPTTIWLNRADVAWIGPTLGWIAFPWMALVAITVTVLAALDLGRLAWTGWRRLAARGANEAPADPSRRRALARLTGGAAVVASTATVAAGLRTALGDPEITTVEIAIPGLDPRFDGFTIAQLTDLHVGMTIDRDYVARVVAQVNAIGADVIAVTGDMVDGTVAALAHDVAPLGELRAPAGVYFVIGNHELYAGVEPWRRHFAGLGLTPLRNQHVVLRRGDAALVLAGVDDHTGGKFGAAHAPRYDDALAGRPADAPVVLLAHQPRQIVHAIRHRVALQLSGHTHGGQVWPWHFVVALQQGGRVAGRYDEQGTTLYVCRGAGYWGPPVRVGAPPEIARIVLRAPR